MRLVEWPLTATDLTASGGPLAVRRGGEELNHIVPYCDFHQSSIIHTSWKSRWTETSIVLTSIRVVTSCTWPTIWVCEALGRGAVTRFICSWFQTFSVFWMLYAFFWVIPRSLNFIFRRFGTLCMIHLHRQVGVEWIGFKKIWGREKVWLEKRGVSGTEQAVKGNNPP